MKESGERHEEGMRKAIEQLMDTKIVDQDVTSHAASQSDRFCFMVWVCMIDGTHYAEIARHTS